MQELENILEEIEQRKARAEKLIVKPPHDKLDQVANDTAEAFIEAYKECQDIIRKHMNDRWISVEDRLPEDDVNVLITYADIDDDQYVGIDITNYGYAYLGGNKLDFKEWRSPFEYFRSNYKVIAWQPLPEPYRSERSRENEK